VTRFNNSMTGSSDFIRRSIELRGRSDQSDLCHRSDQIRAFVLRRVDPLAHRVRLHELRRERLQHGRAPSRKVYQVLFADKDRGPGGATLRDETSPAQNLGPHL
jgi:hypothetical protein